MLSKLGRVDNHCPHYPTFGSFPMSPRILHFICSMCSSSGDHVFTNCPLTYIYIANSLQSSNRKLLLAHINHVEDDTLGVSVALPAMTSLALVVEITCNLHCAIFYVSTSTFTNVHTRLVTMVLLPTTTCTGGANNHSIQMTEA